LLILLIGVGLKGWERGKKRRREKKKVDERRSQKGQDWRERGEKREKGFRKDLR